MWLTALRRLRQEGQDFRASLGLQDRVSNRK